MVDICNNFQLLSGAVGIPFTHLSLASCVGAFPGSLMPRSLVYRGVPGEGRGALGRELQPLMSSDLWRDPRLLIAVPLLPTLMPGEFRRKEDDAWD